MVEIQQNVLKTDVTSIKYIDGYILTGIGNCIHVFTKAGLHLQKYTIFSGQKVHGIVPCDNRLAAYGSHKFKIFVYDSPQIGSELVFKHCEDWILLFKWLDWGRKFVTVFGNNYVGLWNADTYELNLRVACEARCIIYSAETMRNTWEDLVVLSGTLANEVLVWQPSLNSSNLSGVLCKLVGHNGATFSIQYNETVDLIASTSEDSTVRLWNTLQFFNRKRNHVNPNLQIYGHKGRIFLCKLTDNYVVSAGEDSLLCIWKSSDGKPIRTFGTRQNNKLWALEVNEPDNFILTGGSDSALCRYPIKLNGSIRELPFDHHSMPRCLKCLPTGNIVVLTDNGTLKYYREDVNQVDDVCVIDGLENYAVMTMNNEFVVIAGIHGTIHIYQELNNTLNHILTTNNSKGRIYSVIFLNDTMILTSEENGVLKISSLNTEERTLEATNEYILPVSKERWATSAAIFEDKIAVGDRKGNIYLYVLNDKNPVQTIKKAQSHLGATALYYMNNRLISFGRNGIVKKYYVDSGRLELVSNDKLPFSWLASIVQKDNIILYIGFSGSNFIIWDESARRILLEVNCGGGHRSWDFRIINDVIYLSFIKLKRVHRYTCPWEDIFIGEIVESFHVKEINCAKIVALSDNQYLIISGGEDTTIQLSHVNLDVDNSFRTISILKSHLSSVRVIHMMLLSDDNYLLFTGGGRAQIILWELKIDAQGAVQYNELDMYHKDLDENESEIRIMDFTTVRINNYILLITACSNGMIKCFTVNTDQKYQLTFAKDMCYFVVCIMRLFYVKLLDCHVLVTLGSRGNITFWDITDFCTLINNPDALEYEEFSRLYDQNVHQTGINAFDYKLLSDDTILLVTGGDDNSLKINIFKLSIGTLTHVFDLSKSDLHAAQITGVFLTDSNLFTTSIDQMVTVFSYSCAMNKVTLDLLKEYDSVIDDIQGFNCVAHHNKIIMCLYGVGLELCTINIQ